MILEIAAFSVEDTIVAANAGANRIELCSNYEVGGITCSKEILAEAISKISIPIFPIIRPRAGDFVYTDDEFEIMKMDVLLCKQLGFSGIVTGILNSNNTIDKVRTKELVALANPLPVTFHRAFDETVNPLQALEDIIECGCKRILSSGQKNTAIDGKELLQQLIHQAKERIIIILGGGVRSNHLAELKDYTNAIEFHSSARTNIASAIDTIELHKLVIAVK